MSGVPYLHVAGAVVLAAFVAMGLRALVLALAARPRRAAAIAARLAATVVWLGLSAVYWLLAGSALRWTESAVLAAGLTAAVVLAGLVVPRRRGRGAPGPAAALVHLCLLLVLLLAGALTLMTAGFVALTADRPVLLLDATGETAERTVRWTPPGQAPREETLRAHRVVFRALDGTPVAEAWIHGDEVAVKGRVLRLSPALNAAGVPNLFELRFAHNGYTTAERHGVFPHTAIPLPPVGPLAVHPWWRRLQARLLEGWERHTAEDQPWAVRSVTVESTYFPLVDARGEPVRHTYRLVLTPGGLSSS